MTQITNRTPVKYLTNKELLAEIARCKKTFCTFTDPIYQDYDAIVSGLEYISPTLIDEILERLNAKLPEEEHKTRDGLVFRVMTYDHVPLDPTRKRKSRATNQNHSVVNFPPFKHFLLREHDGETIWEEVGRSHWEGDFETGHFTTIKGRMSERMGRMFMKLVERYSSKPNWRNYSYKSEMQGLALTHLAQVGLQFDESKSNNPFAFYTTTISHCFTRILNLEKKNQSIRDELLINAGMAPSSTRQIANEMERSGHIPPAKMSIRRGRKTAVAVAAEKKDAQERDEKPE